jgi:hypothetical protein
MKKLYFLFAGLCLFFATTTAQTFEWLKTVPIDYEYNPDMIKYSTTTDQNGDVYFFGLKEFSLFYNEAMGSLFLKKYNSAGDLLWDKTITGEAETKGIYSDNSGGIFLYGESHSNLDFWGELILNMYGTGTNSFLVKTNTYGEIDWGLNLEDLPLDEGFISDVVSETSGMIYIAYSTWAASYIVVLNSQGQYISSIEQENVSLVSGLDIDDDGDIYAVGGCAGSFSKFGGVSFPAPFPYSSYVVKYNSAYEPVWVKFIEDVTCMFLKVKCDNNGGIFVTSQVFAETMLDTITVHGATWVYDFYLTRLSPQGEFQWALECPEVLTGDATVGKLQYLTSDSDGNAVLAGFTRGTIDWGNGIVSTTEDYYYNIIVWNVNPQGSINWIKTAAGEGYDDSHSITTDPEGNIYLAGIAGGTSVFDTITYVTDDFVYPFLAKLNTQSMTQITEKQAGGEMVVYPNPARGYIFIQPADANSFEIFNSFGQLVKEGLSIQNLQKIDIGRLNPGIYFIRLKFATSNSFITSRFVIR